MLYKVFDFADKEVSDVMVPRPEVVALSVDLPPEQALQAVLDSPYTRYPVYRGSLDEIVGVLHVRDLIEAMHERGIASVEVEDLLRPAVHGPGDEGSRGAADRVPAARTSTWRSSSTSTASMEGIVTLEDVLEEIVGEIEDEFDLPDESVERIDEQHDPDRRHVPDRRLQRAVRPRRCRRRTTTRSPASSSACSAAPAEVGDEIEADGLRFRVDEVEGTRIQRLTVTFLETPPEQVAAEG